MCYVNWGRDPADSCLSWHPSPASTLPILSDRGSDGCTRTAHGRKSEQVVEIARGALDNEAARDWSSWYVPGPLAAAEHQKGRTAPSPAAVLPVLFGTRCGLAGFGASVLAQLPHGSPPRCAGSPTAASSASISGSGRPPSNVPASGDARCISQYARPVRVRPCGRSRR